MTALLSFSIRRTSVKCGRSAMFAMTSANSYHLRPHCTRRTASAITCSRTVSDGPWAEDSDSDGDVGAGGGLGGSGGWRFTLLTRNEFRHFPGAGGGGPRGLDRRRILGVVSQ